MKEVPACISRMLPIVLALGLGATGLGLGCKAKPSEKACREAIENIRRISGQDANTVGADPIAAIRSCRGNSSKEAVECMRVAKTLQDLEKCEAQAGGLPAPAPAATVDKDTAPATEPPAAPAKDEAAAAPEPVPAAPAASAKDEAPAAEPAAAAP